MARVPSRGSDQFVVRFPPRMRDRIREAADGNGRSMNAEILARLERAETQGENWDASQLVKQLVIGLIDHHDEIKRNAAIFAGLTFLADFPLEAARLRFAWEQLRPKGPAKGRLTVAQEADITAMIDQMVGPEVDTLVSHLQQEGWTVRPPKTNELPAATGEDPLERDVRLIISLIEQEIAGEVGLPEAEMETELGDRLSDAVSKRTEQAMTYVVDRLKAAGLLSDDIPSDSSRDIGDFLRQRA